MGVGKTTILAAIIAAITRGGALPGQETTPAGDAIWVSCDGQVLEAPTSSVLVARDGELLTPPTAELGLLPSLTVARLRRLVPIWGLSGQNQSRKE